MHVRIHLTKRQRIIAAASSVIVLAIIGALVLLVRPAGETAHPSSTSKNNQVVLPNGQTTPAITNPLHGKSLYVESGTRTALSASAYQSEGKTAEARMLNKIAAQPTAIWLTGPNASSPNGELDIARVAATSTEAAAQKKVVLYELYAVPRRDGCAAYSQGGFASNQAYLAWLEKILGALKSEAVFSVEADAVAHALKGDCLSPAQVTERYSLLNSTLARLKDEPKVLASYLDAGNADWLPDPAVLVQPLKSAGIEHARGVAVNVSNFIATDKTTTWVQSLMGLLGENKGAIIDTGRNGNGAPGPEATGEARWCNPRGRAIGALPNVAITDKYIDAHVWIKTVGESDGSCFGWPSAGTFVPELAFEMAKNAGF